jgi:hypothetical protein
MTPAPPSIPISIPASASAPAAPAVPSSCMVPVPAAATVPAGSGRGRVGDSNHGVAHTWCLVLPSRLQVWHMQYMACRCMPVAAVPRLPSLPVPISEDTVTCVDASQVSKHHTCAYLCSCSCCGWCASPGCWGCGAGTCPCCVNGYAHGHVWLPLLVACMQLTGAPQSHCQDQGVISCQCSTA